MTSQTRGEPAPAYTYVLLASDGRVKVGVTTQLAERIRTLRTGSGLELVLHACYPGAPEREKQLHQLLAGHRQAGEWFAPDCRAALDRYLIESGAKMGWPPAEPRMGWSPTDQVWAMTAEAQVDVVSAVEAFLQGAQSRGLSPKTMEAYNGHLRTIFLPWCRKTGLIRAAELDRQVIERFAIHLQERRTNRGQPLARASQKSYLRSVAQFLSWGRQEGLISTGTTAPNIRLRKARKDVLNRQELHALELAARTERDRLLIRVMGDTGAREGEVANLQVADVMRMGRVAYMRFNGKTGERLVPIADDLYRRLVDYRDHNRPESRSQTLFLGDRRRSNGEYERLTEGGIYQAVREAVKRAKIQKRIYPHLLRASAITQMTSKGMHPALVSELTGVSVTVIASSYSFPTLEQSHEALLRALDE